MTGHDAATVEACAARLDALLRTGNDLGANYRNATIAQSQEAIRALPIAPPAPLQVTGVVGGKKEDKRELRVAVMAAEKFLREIGTWLLENDLDMMPGCPDPDPELLADDLRAALNHEGKAA